MSYVIVDLEVVLVLGDMGLVHVAGEGLLPTHTHIHYYTYTLLHIHIYITSHIHY